MCRYRIELVKSGTVVSKEKAKAQGKGSSPVYMTLIYEIKPSGEEAMIWKESGSCEEVADMYLSCAKGVSMHDGTGRVTVVRVG
jgi:hypothetical protein